MVLPDGTEESVAIGDLYTMVYGTEESAIRAAFQEGQLRVRTVHPETGEVADLPCTAVLKHHTPHKKMMRVELEDERSAVFTEDHSLFVPKGDGLEVMKAGDLRAGDTIITVKDGQKSTAVVAMVEETLAAETTYDLSVPGPQNFMLANGILAHNSYSIGGISMDIEKSSKYESIKSNAEGQFQMAVEAKKNTTLFIRGLCQPRYGLGIRSAFGPHTGRGTLGPRSFI